MKVNVSFDASWNELEWDCPNCDSGKFKAKLPDFTTGKLVRCSNGCEIRLTEDGSVTKIQKMLGDFSK